MMEKNVQKKVKKMFSKLEARAKATPRKRAKVWAKKKATTKRVQRALTTLGASKPVVRRKRVQTGKAGRVAHVTQTKQGLLIQYYKPKQLHFRFPSL